MCKIRIIRKGEGSAIYSSIVEFAEININPIDRPAYVVYINKDTCNGLSFIFSSEKEPKTQVQLPNLYLEYGNNSGRIYQAALRNDSINQTDAFSILNSFRNESRNERFNENVKGFISLINSVIEFVKDNPIR